MSWIDRIKEAAYVSPSGERITFDYEDVSSSFDKKTAAFDFADGDGTYIQENGNTSKRYPLRVFFWGSDYDLESTAFEDAISERGVGKLEHPLYGFKNVVPTGTIRRRDDLKTAANQSIFEIVFWETIDLVYPIAQDDPAAAVVAAVKEYNDASAEEFEEITSLESAVEQARFKSSYQLLLDQATSALQVIADAQENVEKQFNAVKDSINQSLDILVQDPLTLAFQTNILVQAPARAVVDIQARLDAFVNLGASIISTGVTVPGLDSQNSNDFHAKDLYASGYVTGSIISVLNNTFSTKRSAIEAAEVILNQFGNLVVWRDDNFESLSEIDTGSSYQQLQEAVAVVIGFLVEISFSLKQERIIVLDRNRTIVDLVAELYGSIDDQLDFFISSNNLSGSEIIELQQGREIVYYI